MPRPRYDLESGQYNSSGERSFAGVGSKHRTTTMKSIAGRIQRLEERVLPAPETESSRLLRARIEAGRRRLREMYGENAPVEVLPNETVA